MSCSLFHEKALRIAERTYSPESPANMLKVPVLAGEIFVFPFARRRADSSGLQTLCFCLVASKMIKRASSAPKALLILSSSNLRVPSTLSASVIRLVRSWPSKATEVLSLSEGASDFLPCTMGVGVG